MHHRRNSSIVIVFMQCNHWVVCVHCYFLSLSGRVCLLAWSWSPQMAGDYPIHTNAFSFTAPLIPVVVPPLLSKHSREER